MTNKLLPGERGRKPTFEVVNVERIPQRSMGAGFIIPKANNSEHGVPTEVEPGAELVFPALIQKHYVKVMKPTAKTRKRIAKSKEKVEKLREEERVDESTSKRGKRSLF